MARHGPAPFSAEDFRLRAARSTAARIGGFRLWRPPLQSGPSAPRPGASSCATRAVLIPVVDHGPEAKRHPDQARREADQPFGAGGVSGRAHRSDRRCRPEAAALREAEEEIGLDPGHVEMIGRMPDYVSGSGYRIAPVLSIVRPGFHLTINEHEVDAAFEVPLRFLMDPANHTQQQPRVGRAESGSTTTCPMAASASGA